MYLNTSKAMLLILSSGFFVSSTYGQVHSGFAGKKHVTSTIDSTSSNALSVKLTDHLDSTFLVTSETAWFYNAPAYYTKTNKYLVSNDTIHAYKQNNAYVYTEFENSKGFISKGWLSKNDLTLINIKEQVNGNSNTINKLPATNYNDLKGRLLDLSLLESIRLSNSHSGNSMFNKLKDYNSNWSYKGTDVQSGELFFGTFDQADKELFVWHSKESAVEYFTLNSKHFDNLVQALLARGFKLANRVKSDQGINSKYIKDNTIILTLSTLLTKPGTKGYKLFILEN